MRTSVNISFFVSAEPAASTASKKDYRSTAYNNYCIKSAAPRHCSSELDDAQVLHDFSWSESRGRGAWAWRLLPLLMLSGHKDGGALTANLTDRIAVPMKISALFWGAARCRSVLWFSEIWHLITDIWELWYRSQLKYRSSCFICKKFVVHLQYEKDVFTCNNGVNHYIIVWV